MMEGQTLNISHIAEKARSLDSKILFIGGLNLDIQSVPDYSDKLGDSLIGKIVMSPGGVIRNIAENCSLLGLDCTLLSVLGDDAAGSTITKETKASGVNMDHCLIMNNARSCCYSAFLDAHGEMLYAVNDMSLIDHLTPEFLIGQSDTIDDSQYIVMDSNIPESSIQFLTGKYPEKILLIDPVSAAKIERVRGSVESIKIFKSNRIETEAFTGMHLNNSRDFYKALDFYLNLGIERIFISAGSRGIYYADSNHKGCSQSFPVEVKSVTGAGDAASAALILSVLLGLDIREAAIFANLTAVSSLMSAGTINKKLSFTYLENLYKEFINEPFVS